MSIEARIQNAADAVMKRLGKADTAIVLGSGLGHFSSSLMQSECLASSEIPDYPVSTVPGHAGVWWRGSLSGHPVFMLQGRVHAYEGLSMEDVTLYVRMLSRLGVKTLILTNASGCANSSWNPGEIMALSDHINLSGLNPLVGPNLDAFGPRFPDMTEAYDRKLRLMAHEAADENGILLREGVYAWFLGPTYETPAEVRMAQTLGADAVGMSTVPEVIVARHCGIRVLALSCMTNMAAGLGSGLLQHEEVIETADRAGKSMEQLIACVVGKLEDE